MRQHKGIIAWFAYNSVAANLLMVLILAVGIASAINIKKRIFPDFELDIIKITVVYPGASPADIATSINQKIEDAVNGIAGIKAVRSTATEGFANVELEIDSGFNFDELLDDVKIQVEAIPNLPLDAEKPIVSRFKLPQNIIFVTLYGELNKFDLQTTASQYRDHLLNLPSVERVDILGDQEIIVAIEISEQTLREYQLTFDEIAQQLRGSSIDLSAGAIKSTKGDILLRTRGQAWNAQDFSNIVVREFSDGTQLKLSEIALVRETFANELRVSRFNQQQAVNLMVVSEGDGSDIQTTSEVKQWIEQQQDQLPKGMHLTFWGDVSFYLKGRLNMMMENMAIGALLVFLMLTLFLRLRIAFWVMVGIPISFLGALALMAMGPIPVSINIISLFAFILVLGVVVDDAIIIGESAFDEINKHGPSVDNVINGVKRVVVPASFGVLTTIAAFAPILTVSGVMAPFFQAIALVVIWCLVFSLIESKLILPAHLAHTKTQARLKNEPHTKRFSLSKAQDFVAERLQTFIENTYTPWLTKALRARYTTLALFAGCLIVTAGAMKGDLIKVALFPNVPSDFIEIALVMNPGSDEQARNKNLAAIVNALVAIDSEYRQTKAEKNGATDEKGIVKHSIVFSNGDSAGDVIVELTKAESRSIDAYEFTDLMRKRVGELPNTKLLTFAAGTNAGGGKPVNFRLTSEDPEIINAAAEELEDHLKSLPGLFDIDNQAESGAEEIIISMLPGAQAMGLNLNSIGRQVRQGFYGEEVERFLRANNEIKVLLRYPESERDTLGDLETIRVRAEDGNQIPIEEAAHLERSSSFNTIHRINGERSVSVSADINTKIAEPDKIVESLEEDYLPTLAKKYPGLTFAKDGASLEEEKMARQIGNALMLAMFLVYALIAIPLKSYSQPLIIMSIIPFGLIGAVFGHIVLGLNISLLSIYGIIALSGVLVNDSLILVDFINRNQKAGGELFDAVITAGKARFRAIFLTSLTTFLGLAPILFERELQAQFVIPMATSLGFGILFATAITLFLIPTLYLVLDDLGTLVKRWRDWIYASADTQPR